MVLASVAGFLAWRTETLKPMTFTALLEVLQPRTPLFWEPVSARNSRCFRDPLSETVLESFLEPLAVLGPHLDDSRAIIGALGSFWVALGRPYDPLELSLVTLGPLLGSSWVLIGRPWSQGGSIARFVSYVGTLQSQFWVHLGASA